MSLSCLSEYALLENLTLIDPADAYAAPITLDEYEFALLIMTSASY